MATKKLTKKEQEAMEVKTMKDEAANDVVEMETEAVIEEKTEDAPQTEQLAAAQATATEAPTRPIKAGRVLDDGNDLVSVTMPEDVQQKDIDDMQRAIARKKICFAAVMGVEPFGVGVKIVAKRGTIRVVFIAEDFFAHSTMKGIENDSDEMRAIRYRRKAVRMMGAIVSFIPKQLSYDEGVPFVVASRREAMDAMRERFFFGDESVEPGMQTKANILSVGPSYALVEALGVETTMGTGALSAYQYIDNVAEKYHVGDALPVAIEAVSIDKDNKTVNLRVSHSLLERLTSKTEVISESMVDGIYMATIVSVTDRYYHVVLDGKKVRGIIAKTAIISDGMLGIGDKVAMKVRAVNVEKELVIGGGHKIA